MTLENELWKRFRDDGVKEDKFREIVKDAKESFKEHSRFLFEAKIGEIEKQKKLAVGEANPQALATLVMVEVVLQETFKQLERIE